METVITKTLDVHLKVRLLQTICIYCTYTAKLATSGRNGPKELPEVVESEEQCRNDDLPPDFLCHGAGW